MVKKPTNTGIVRFQYMPYRLDIALSVVERIGRKINPAFRLIPGVLEIYTELVKYFHGDPGFNGDLTKGILLMGPTGTGKSVAMEIMNTYGQIDDIKFLYEGKPYRMNYQIADPQSMISQFLEFSYDGIDTYCRRRILCIDEIGTESAMVKYYGNTIDVLSHVLAERYTRKLLTFGTTNYPISVLEKMYDDRIVSRMYSLFNFFVMKGPDFRKNTKPLES